VETRKLTVVYVGVNQHQRAIIKEQKPTLNSTRVSTGNKKSKFNTR